MKRFLILFLLLPTLLVISCGDDDDDSSNSADDDDSENDDDSVEDDDDDDDDNDDDDDDNDDNDDDDLASCDYEYTQFPGWFEIPDLYYVAKDFANEFGPGVSADCEADLDGVDLTVDCGPFEFSAEWIADTGNFPLVDGQDIKAFGYITDGDMGFAHFWIFDSDSNPLIFQTTDWKIPFDMDGEIIDVHVGPLPICAFDNNDPGLPLAGDAYWNYLNALGVSGNILDSIFEVDVQGEPVESYDGEYLVKVLYGYDGTFDWPEENWWGRPAYRINVQVLANL